MIHATPQTIPLPILPPRDAWPRLLRAAADVLQEMIDTQGGFKTLPHEVRLIAESLEATATDEQRRHAALVAAAIAEAIKRGSITQATAAYHRACCADPYGFRRFLDFAFGQQAQTKAPGEPDRFAFLLNEEERATCASFGVSASEFIAARDNANGGAK